MIRTENLSMHYGPVKALDNVSFEIKKNEIIGLLGPNGAGKSTTLKILTTYIYPTEGTAYVADRDVREDSIAIRQMIGYLPEQLPLYTDMEVREYLRFVGNARGIHGVELRKRLDWVVEKCGLKLMYRKVIRELSKGYRQRTALAQALLHNPEIVILDEPTSGLDPHQILEIRALIQELAKEKTIIFSSHILQEVQAIASRLIVINRGKIVADGSREELEKAATKGKHVQLTLPKDIKSSEVKKAISSLSGVSEVTDNTNKELSTYDIFGNLEEDIQKSVATTVKEKGWDFYELKNVAISLENIFLGLTEPAKSEN